MFKISSNKEKNKIVEENVNDKGDVYIDENNKLIVKEKKSTNISKRKNNKDILDIDNDSEDEVEESKNKKSKNGNNNGKEETLAARMLKKHNMVKKDVGLHMVRESGEIYKAKGSTRGDVSIPGKAAPHAFIQLNPMV